MPSGDIGYWENTAGPIRDATGNIVACLEIARNITERKRNEKALQNSERRYRTLLHNIPGMIYQGNPDWTAEVIANSDVICGYSVQDLNSKKSTGST